MVTKRVTATIALFTSLLGGSLGFRTARAIDKFAIPNDTTANSAPPTGQSSYDANAISTQANYRKLINSVWEKPPGTASSDPLVIKYTTHSLSRSTSQYDNPNPLISEGDVSLTEAQRTVLREAMDEIEAVCNVKFIEMTDETIGESRLVVFAANIIYNYDTDENGTRVKKTWGGLGNLPSTTQGFSNLIVNKNEATGKGTNRGLTKETFIHELLHNLGLMHTFDTNMLKALDSLNASALAYEGGTDDKVGGQATINAWDAPEVSLQSFDIAALQESYGRNPNHAPGDTVYYLVGNRLAFTIDDAGGFNAISARYYKDPKSDRTRQGVRIDLRNEDPSQMSIVGDDGSRVWIANNTTVQAGIGSPYDDTLFSGGHGQTYYLEGGAGKDTFYVSRHSRTVLLDYKNTEHDRIVFHRGEFAGIKLHAVEDGRVYIQARHKDGYYSEVYIPDGDAATVLEQLRTDHPYLNVQVNPAVLSTSDLKERELFCISQNKGYVTALIALLNDGQKTSEQQNGEDVTATERSWAGPLVPADFTEELVVAEGPKIIGPAKNYTR